VSELQKGPPRKGFNAPPTDLQPAPAGDKKADDKDGKH
jgi:hypothetical protein